MTFLQQYDEQEGQPEAQNALVSHWIRTDWQPFFAELRAVRPILRTPHFTLVSRYDDVTEILAREQDFSVRLYAPKMDPVVGGPFMLSRDDTPVNWREKGIMQAMLRPEDVPGVRAMARDFTEEALDAAAPTGRVDVVTQIGRYVPIRLCGAYFGFSGPDIPTMYRWSRTTQFDMFKNIQGIPEIHESSVQSGREMRAYLVDLLDRTRASTGRDAAPTGRVSAVRLLRALGRHAVDAAPQPPPQDVLSRLVRTELPDELGFDDQRAIANLAGLLIGTGETTSQAVAQSLRQILCREQVRHEATAAASEAGPDDFDPYVWEALRLDPINPLLFRFTERDTRVAAGTPRETLIPQGTVVFALTASAMSDETRVVAPDEFRIGRPDFLDLHFGYGHHACLGRYVGAAIVPEIVRRILLRPGVDLLAAPQGDLDFKGGPFPEQFEIALDAAEPVAAADKG